MSTTSIPRFLLPRGTKALSLSRYHLPENQYLEGLCSIQFLPSRHASSSSSSSSKSPPPGQPRILEKPSKFTPPSHPARLNRKPPRSYPGPPLSPKDKEAQKTKQYPHMMPPEGSFLRWFLTNRSIHVYITLSTLFSLALFTTFTNFRQTSPFAHMLPPTSDIFSHPIAFVSTYTEVFKLHTAHKSEETAERRKKKVDDAMKRKQYRKAHGMDSAQGGGVGGWFASLGEEPEKEEMANTTTDSSPTTADAAADAAREYADFEGRKRPVKKWLGIW